MKRQPICAVPLALCLLSMTARADPPVAPPGGTTRLEYIRGPGAETCPDEQALRNYVAARMSGDDPFTPTGATRLTVTITGRGDEFFGHIALDNGTGRVLVYDLTGGPTCAGFLRDFSLSIRLIVRPFSAPAVAAPSAPPPAAPPPPLAAPRVLPAPPPPLPPPGDGTPGPQFALGGGALVAFGSAPGDTALGINAFVRLHWPTWSLVLNGRGEFPADRMVSGSLLALSTAPCVHHALFLDWEALACHVSTVGVMRGYAPSWIADDDSSSPYLATGVRLGVEVPLWSPFSAQALGDISGSLIRPAVRIDHAEAWRAKDVVGTVGLQVVGTFF